MLRSGTTCFNDMYFFPEISADIAAQAGIRASIGMIMIDFPTAYAQNPDDYLKKGLALYDNYKDHPLIKVTFAPHAPYTVSDKPLEKIRSIAAELGCQIHMHIHETAHEVSESVSNFGMRPLERLERLGLLTPELMAVHMTQLSDSEINSLADNGCHVIHCPESNMKLASGFCPAQRLVDGGINVALGTDGTASNNDLDMFGEMRTAAFIAKGYNSDPQALSAATALKMATINGAKALGIDDTTGSLKAGKSADIVAIDMGQLETSPIYNPLSHLVYSTSKQQVSSVWVRGRQLLANRKLTTLDEGKIYSNTRSWNRIIEETRTDAAKQ